MTAMRFQHGSTSDNVNTLIREISRPGADVRLFATHRHSQGGFDPRTSGPESNLPLLVSLVFDGRRSIIFDGFFLTAARMERAAEVALVLNHAVADGNVVFGTVPVDFTADMTADEAEEYLKSIPTMRLDEKSRPKFSKMIYYKDDL